MDLLAIVGFISGFFSLLLAFIILLKAKEKVHFIWTIFLLSVSLWGWGMLGFSTAHSELFAIVWWRVAEVGLILVPVSITHFILEFLSLIRIRRLFLSFLYFVTFIFLLLNIFTDYFFGPLRYAYGVYFYISPTPYYLIFIAFFVLLLLYNIYLLLDAYNFKLEKEKNQIKFLLFAFVVGFSGVFTSFLPIYGVNVYPAWNMTIFFSALIITYTIVRYRLMDLKFVMRKYTVYTISILAIFLPALAIKYYSIKYSAPTGRTFDLLFLIAAISLFPLLKGKTSQLANKYFFSSMYSSQELIAEVSERLRSTLNINQIYDFIFTSIDEAMHVKSFGVLRYEEKKGRYSTQFNINFNIGRRVYIDKNEVLQKYFEEERRYLVVSEAAEFEYDSRTKEVMELLHQMSVELLLPLTIKGKVVGLLVLGEKESGDVYNEEDIQVLSIIASQSAMAIENAILYKETKNFSLLMEDEVKRATADLRIANERLKKLDEAKSEFISIASHQLRTPLTVIKGYISMAMEGSFGEVSVAVIESMSKVFESNERLISLVDNLLNVSRIESGHLKFNYEQIDIRKIVEGIVEELTVKAKIKGLDLRLKADKDMPEMLLDVEKIRQVVMNLIDNSIKYTGSGKISVVLSKIGDRIRFCVSDNGIGINAGDIPNLFKKFARGTSAMLQHTEGTGLGLYVAKEMIDAHQGKIWAESKGEGKGSKFCFELPIAVKKEELTEGGDNNIIKLN